MKVSRFLFWCSMVPVLSAVLVLPAQAQSLVVNEFRNATPDVVELLVITGNLDMQGMIVKHYRPIG